MATSNESGNAAPPETAGTVLPFPIVGLGASAGGLAPLTQLFEGLPGVPGMSFVVVMHLSPKHESNAPEILQRSTRMTVKQVTAPTRIERNHVYVIPPRRALEMRDGTLDVTTLQRTNNRPGVIDRFFRALAKAHRERAVAVVLSGTGSDGSAGIGEIKGQGGVVIAQSPDDAEFDGMPASAIATGKVDLVLPAADIPQKLLDIWSNAQRIELPSGGDGDTGIIALPPTSPERAEQALRNIMRILQARTGHDFKHYKRATVLRRIERRLQVNELPDLPSYERFLETHPGESAPLLGDMLIGVTNFFRDREAFEALERLAIPKLFTEVVKDDPLRAWVAGCSTGEEAYSILMLLHQEAEATAHRRQIQLFASDIDEQALGKAREGRYPASIAVDVPPASLRKWMSKDDDYYRVNKPLRESILFAQHNLLRDPPFSRLDLISCRNLLIYLDRDVQKDILQMFHFALRPGGYLFLGSSETADAASRLFVAADKKHRIFQSVSTTRGMRVLPRFPLGGLEHRVPGGARGGAAKSIASLHEQLLLEDSAPSILIKPDGEIMHTSRAEQFLRFASGVPSQNVFAAIRPELRPAVRSALFQATQGIDSAPIVITKVSRAGEVFDVTVKARIVRRDDWPGELHLLSVEERAEAAGSDASALGAAERGPLVHQLETALQRKDQQLQEVIAQYETSVDDLRASNEELQAINEELRSTTEELETSKEELQATNEELITVNHELKSKVEEASEVNDDLENLMSSSGIATIFVDRDLRIKRFAPSAATIFNVLPGDIGRSLLDITNKLTYPAIAADAETAFRTLNVMERELASDDGRWFLARTVPYRTSADRIDGAVITFVDITSRHRAQVSSDIDQERMQMIAASMPDFAILTIDEDGKLTSWSAGAERLFGYKEEEILGEYIGILFTPEDRERGTPADEMRQARETGRANDERWHLHKNGSRVFVSGIMSPMRLGKVRGYAKIARDMTARAHADSSRELALMTAVNEASSAAHESHMKDEFLAIMSHELKHPLNLIQVNAQLLLALPEAARMPSIVRAAETIQKTVRSQARIIDDLLDVSRTRTGKLVLNRSVVDLKSVLQGTVAWGRQQAAEKGIRFDVDASDSPLPVDIDPTRIEQVALNLVSNAVKFTSSGGSVSVRLYRKSNDAILEVADSGRGIDAELLPHIFELFKQGDAYSTRDQGGLGIGLALVKDIVDLHGGRVTASSGGAGKGARFEVALTLHQRDDGAQVPTGSSENALAGLKILCVDDSVETLELFSTLLGIHGATVIVAGSGQEAIAAAGAHDGIDLIISDIGMPQMDGYELITELRRDPRLAHVPAIALTGYGRTQDVQRALASGFTAHIDKPVDIARLQALVELLRPRAEAAQETLPENSPARR